jgi:hypothetical protein
MLLQKFSSIKQPRGFWEDSFPSASVNARQKSSIEFATVDQVPAIIKGYILSSSNCDRGGCESSVSAGTFQLP